VSERTVVDRRASRVLLIDEFDRVLLFRGCDPALPEVKYWFSVGGGIDEGEDVRQAACREVFEETGIRVDPAELVGPIHEEVTEFGFDGRWIRQHQVFFVLRVVNAVIDTAGFEAIEVATMDCHRWWSVSDLRTTTQTCHPSVLGTLLSEAVCLPR
jgi:8-oxo-dGTP pyrophosphatase MutT (NUDIX family)